MVREPNDYSFMADLTASDIRKVHDRIMGPEGDHRILSEPGLEELVFRANLVPDAIQKAALVLYSLRAYPVFREGNNETAIDLCAQVLAADSIRISGEIKELAELADGVDSFTVEPEDIGNWLMQNTEKAVFS